MKKWVKWAGVIFVVFLMIAAWQAWNYYHRIFSPAAVVKEESALLYIPTGASFTDVCDSLIRYQWVSDISSFTWLARQKDYTDRIRPGRYRIHHGMSLNALINKLRSGDQEPVRLIIRPFRNLKDLSGFLSSQLEPNTEDFLLALTSDSLLTTIGLRKNQAMLSVIPNTYEVWWTISATGFAKRMADEYERFWNEDRRTKASQAGLSPAQVGVLASIVQEETNKRDEMSKIAGVYLNRLKIGMLLQADPTVKYAHNDPAIKRILFRHLEIDSPYNTYRYAGLPPGPISMPEIFVIDAVLKAEKHAYYFFCARADLSGYHAFARTGAEHARNARAYQQALNRQGIY